MILLETIALTQAAASVTFDNLPTSGYTDLKVVLSVRNSAGINAWDDIYVDINGSSSNFTSRVLYGTGSAANSISFSSSIAQVGEGNAGTANTFSNTEIYFPNYLSTTTAKSFSADSVSENNATASLAQLGAGLWNPGTQAAISSLTFRTFTSGNFVANSTFSLYGVAALGATPVLAPKADGGNVIENDGTYWIHTFTSSGTFTPQTGLTCDALVVAGGAGGGNGGSAGGAGGAGGATNQDGTVGSNSVFSSITSAGGGTASSSNVRNGGDGGSGGGGYNGSSGGSGNTPTTSPSQGSNGGSGSPSAPNYGGGGGGGASAVGVNGTATSGGNGGAGTANSYSGSSVTYAGGGGGATYQGGTAGLGGAGGGGNAGTSNTNTAGDPGTANTGGGGGGASTTSAYAASGGAGGSGIIIIRYPIA